MTGRLLLVGLLSLIAGATAATRVGAEKLVLVAGGTDPRVDIPAKDALLQGPFATDFDQQGNLYVVEMPGQRLLSIDRHGVLSVLAGKGIKGSAGNGGPAREAELNGSHHILVGPGDQLYVADTWNNCVRRIDLKSGQIDRFAGTGTKGFSGDGGPARDAEFGGVYCLALSAKGERLYVADLDNRRIRVIDMATGNVETVAGNGKRGEPRDGDDARQAPLVDPRAVAVDAAGQVYILERSGNALRVVDTQGRIRTLVDASLKGCQDETGKTPHPLKGPKHLAVDPQGNVLIADTENHQIRKYLPATGQLIVIAGTGQAGAAGLGGPPRDAQLKQPHGVYPHASGIFIADSSNNRVVKIEP